MRGTGFGKMRTKEIREKSVCKVRRESRLAIREFWLGRSSSRGTGGSVRPIDVQEHYAKGCAIFSIYGVFVGISSCQPIL